MKNKFFKTLRVLLVEDEQRLSTLLKNAIGESFYSFNVANDGVEGLALFKKIVPDIIITDIMMPNKTGLEMAQEIRELNANIPIVILSAFSETDKLLSAIDVGVVKYFIKPFDPDELLDYIGSLEHSFGNRVVLLKDDFLFNKTKKVLYKKYKYIALTQKEKQFLLLLIDKQTEKSYILPYAEIKENLWKESVSDERLRTFIRRFRAKTSKDLIQNIKGEGYQIAVVEL